MSLRASRLVLVAALAVPLLATAPASAAPSAAPSTGQPAVARTSAQPTVAGAAAQPTLVPDSTRFTVPAGSDQVPITLGCTARTACTGTVRIDVAGRVGTTLTVWVGPGTRGKKYSLGLTTAQRRDTDFGVRHPGRLRVVQTKPVAAARTTSVSVARASATSTAYRERNWTPAAADTCPASLHRAYSVIGPDGKRYPSWHPPTATDPATGRSCSFGHEHGSDPTTSDIYDWAVARLGYPEGGARQQGIPFGFVSEASIDNEHHGGHAMRHEDNVGHKIVVANDVRQIGASPRQALTTIVAGKEVPLVCDYLAKLHQGSHSADATTNNAHELVYAVRCNDGTELLTSTLARFGDANEYHRGCDPRVVVPTSGSNLPDGTGGRRLIPDASCVAEYVLRAGARSDIWGLYEVWESDSQIVGHDGRVLASHDPWFAVRNPSRYADPSSATGTSPSLGTRWLTDPVDGGTASGFPWSSIAEGDSRDQGSPTSPFDGAQRDFYLASSRVDNAGGPTTWYTSPYGEHASPRPFPGSVRQHLSSTTTDLPELERRQFGLAADFGPSGSGVHSPN